MTFEEREGDRRIPYPIKETDSPEERRVKKMLNFGFIYGDPPPYVWEAVRKMKENGEKA